MTLAQMIDEKNPPHIGRYIKHIFGDDNVTEAARKLGVGRSALSNMLNGKADLSMMMAFRIENAYRYMGEPLLVYQQQWHYRNFIKDKDCPPNFIPNPFFNKEKN